MARNSNSISDRNHSGANSTLASWTNMAWFIQAASQVRFLDWYISIIFNPVPSTWRSGTSHWIVQGMSLVLVVFAEDLCRWLSCRWGLHRGSVSSCRGHCWYWGLLRLSLGADPPSGLDTDRIQLTRVTEKYEWKLSPRSILFYFLKKKRKTVFCSAVFD